MAGRVNPADLAPLSGLRQLRSLTLSASRCGPGAAGGAAKKVGSCAWHWEVPSGAALSCIPGARESTTNCLANGHCLLRRTHEEAGEQLLAGFPDSLLKLKGLTSLAISSLGGRARGTRTVASICSWAARTTQLA